MWEELSKEIKTRKKGEYKKVKNKKHPTQLANFSVNLTKTLL